MSLSNAAFVNHWSGERVETRALFMKTSLPEIMPPAAVVNAFAAAGPVAEPFVTASALGGTLLAAGALVAVSAALTPLVALLFFP